MKCSSPHEAISAKPSGRGRDASPRWLFPAFALILASIFAGCSTSPAPAPSSPEPSVAILIRSTSGQPPTDAQSIVIQQAMQARLTQEGYKLSTDPAASDYLLTISFTPAPPPSNGGRIQLVGLERTANARGLVGISAETEEANALRRKLRDVDQWVDAQWRTRIGEGS